MAMEEVIKKILEFVVSILPILIPSIPGIYALHLQRNKTREEVRKVAAEAKKTDAETKRIDTETSEKIQAVYQELSDDLKKELANNKTVIQKIVNEYNEQKDINTELVKTNQRLLVLAEENKTVIEEQTALILKQGDKLTEQGERITALENLVKILSEQLVELGYEPKVNMS